MTVIMRKVSILGSGNAAEKHRQAFEQLPDLYTISDYESADIIDICTPNSMHFNQACHSLMSGKDILLEKPPCGSLEQMNTLLSLDDISRYGLVYPVFQYRDIPIGAIGDETSVFIRNPSYYSGWRGSYDDAIGGCVISHMIHDISRIVHQYGNIDVVAALGLRFRGGESDYPGVEVETRASVKFIAGDKFFYRTVIITPNGDTQHTPNPGYVDYFRNLDKSCPSLEETRHIMEVVTACYYSAFTGEAVKLPLGQDHFFYSGWQEQMKQHRRTLEFSR